MDADGGWVRGRDAVDPLGYATTFAYAAVGQLTQIYYPANPGSAFLSMTYDTLGRPNQQANANGDVSTLRIAGTRAETDDPTGTAWVSYFTPRGRGRAGPSPSAPPRNWAAKRPGSHR